MSFPHKFQNIHVHVYTDKNTYISETSTIKMDEKENFKISSLSHYHFLPEKNHRNKKHILQFIMGRSDLRFTECLA